MRVKAFSGSVNLTLDELHDPDARDLVEFLYNSAWRSSEPKAMQWHWLDLDNWTVTLPAKFSKNKKPRTLPLEGVLRDVIKRRIKLRDPVSPFVFHRNGKPIKSFRRGFQSAAKRTELADLFSSARYAQKRDSEFQKSRAV
jgi:integrase